MMKVGGKPPGISSERRLPPGIGPGKPPGVFDPDAVLKSIASSSASDRPRRVEQLFIRLAVLDCGKALQKLAQVDRELHPFALLPIVKVLAKSDLSRAKDIAEKMPDGLYKARAFAVVSVRCILAKQKKWREEIQVQMEKMCERRKINLEDLKKEYREEEIDPERACQEGDLFAIKCYAETVDSFGTMSVTETELEDWLEHDSVGIGTEKELDALEAELGEWPIMQAEEEKKWRDLTSFDAVEAEIRRGLVMKAREERKQREATS